MVCLKRRGHARDQRLDDLILAGDDLCVVDPDALDGDAVLFAVRRAVKNLRRIEQRFCRDAAFVEANAADAAFFDAENA